MKKIISLVMAIMVFGLMTKLSKQHTTQHYTISNAGRQNGQSQLVSSQCTGTANSLVSHSLTLPFVQQTILKKHTKLHASGTASPKS